MLTPPSPRRAGAVTTTRRGALVAGGGLLVATGCSVLDDDATSPAPGGSSPTVSVTAPTVDADQDLVDDVLAQVVRTLAVVRAAASAPAGRRDALEALERLHVRHVRTLGARPDRGGSDAPPPVGLAGVRRAEARLRRRLLQGAQDASSGALASLLGSMAAGVAQHEAGLR